MVDLSQTNIAELAFRCCKARGAKQTAKDKPFNFADYGLEVV